MAKELHTTFWGARKADLSTQEKVALERLGIHNRVLQHRIAEARTMEVEDLLRQTGWEPKEMNARQAFQAIK